MNPPSTRPLNVLAVGGSGHYFEKHYYPALRSLRRENIESRIVAICDPIDPHSASSEHYAVGRAELGRILALDRPGWIDPSTLSESRLREALDHQHHETPIDLVIIASDPISHSFYSFWAVGHGISTVCDKPPLLFARSSLSPKSVERLAIESAQLLDRVRTRSSSDPTFTFHVPLKSRSLLPYRAIARGLAEIHERTGQGLTHLAIRLSNGLHRYPVEFLKDGAHGYKDGNGALSHSSYHYLDLIAWYLRIAGDRVARVGVSVPYLLRVSDYLRAKTYAPLQTLVEGDLRLDRHPTELPEAVLGCELDFTLHVVLYDSEGTRLGLLSYSSNHLTFSPRLAKHDPEVLEPGNQKLGGRMKQVWLELHQGAVQNFRLIRDYERFTPGGFELVRRLHPHLGSRCQSTTYGDHCYREGIGPTDLVCALAQRALGRPITDEQEELLWVGTTDPLANELFIAAYRQIAERYADPRAGGEISVPL